MENVEVDYFLLEQELRIPDVTSIAGVPEGIDPYDWTLGKKLDDPPQPVRLQLARSGGEYRGAIISGLVTVFSDPLKNVLTEQGIDNIDYYQAELEHPETHRIESGYWLVNVLGLIECVDESMSTIVPRATGGPGDLKSFFIDPEKTQGFSLFRLHEAPPLIIVDEEVKHAIREADIRGVRLRPTDLYDGF
jgi:hypothetical protein